MTRFARAKGSKASNEKAPEDSTPWEVMRNQLLQAKKESEESKKRQEAEQQRIENYENFLKEHKTRKRQATWCDFPEAAPEHASEKHLQNKQPAQNKKIQNNEPREVNSDLHQTQSKKKKKNTHKKQSITKEKDHNVPQNQMSTSQPTENIKTKKKKNKRAIVEKEDQPLEENNQVSNRETNQNKKMKKNKKKITDPNNSSNSNHDQYDTDQNLTTEIQSSEQNTETVSNNKKKKKPKKMTNPTDSTRTDSNDMEDNKSIINKINKIKALKKKKDKKLIDGKPMRRKPENDRSFQLIINGKEVELEKFDGFPIMKKDAVRIAELKNSMIKKGIPKSEVQRTIKLERRRAEKALARVKKDVCYNCRKGGHNLSDCPDLKSKIPGVDAAEGVCFKCGSTEHRQFECKVQRDKEFRFATCFICREPGHIARQCPDNPKGLYPNGGGCKLCGDVTHLRKDCPTVNDKKEETTVKLQTLATSDNIEEMCAPAKSSAQLEAAKKPKKIKF